MAFYKHKSGPGSCVRLKKGNLRLQPMMVTTLSCKKISLGLKFTHKLYCSITKKEWKMVTPIIRTVIEKLIIFILIN